MDGYLNPSSGIVNSPRWISEPLQWDYNPRDWISESLQGNCKPPRWKQNPSSGIINLLRRYLNPSSEIINRMNGYLNPSSGIMKLPRWISESLQFHWKDSVILPRGLYFHWRDSDIQAEQDEKNKYKLKGMTDEKYGRLTRMINPLKKDIYIPPVEL